MKIFRRLVYYSYSIIEMIFGFKNWLSLLPLFIFRPKSGESVVKLRRPPVQLVVRSAMDVWSIKETFMDAFYVRYGVPIQDGWKVIDVGAGIGDFSIYAAHGKLNTRVYAFEPYKGSYDMLIRNLALNELRNVQAYQKAIWYREGTLALDLSTAEPLQFTSEENPLPDQNQATEMIEAVSLSQILKQQEIDQVDLLKLDCEGAEYEILMKAPSEILSLIDRMVMEYHDRDEEYHHVRLIYFLEDHGYRVWVHKNIIHDHLGFLYADRV